MAREKSWGTVLAHLLDGRPGTVGKPDAPSRISTARPGASWGDFITGGVNFPWTLVASTVLGARLMTTPLTFGTETPLYFSDHIAGCLVIMVAITAMAEVVRPVRLLNLALGVWIASSPFLLGGGTTVGIVADIVIGLALIGLSLPRGTRSNEHYGGWDRAIV